MLRRTPLKPGKPLARSKKPMRRAAPLAVVSKTRQAGRREQSEAYAAAPDAEQCWCSVCGKPGPTEHSHHLSQHHWPQHANDYRNWLVMGCYCGCHQQYENSRAAFAAEHPKLWRAILANIKLVDAQAYRIYRLKYPF